MGKSAREINPNDIVRHIPSWETWVVCGINTKNNTLIPKGHPFPSIAKISDCELLDARYESEPQDWNSIRALSELGLDNYIDSLSGAFHVLAHIVRRTL